MKAIVYTHYGPPEVLQLKELARPVPKDNQVLVQVQAASANALEWRRFTLPPVVLRLFEGRLMKSLNTTLGVDVAGRVEAVGAAVTQFQPGDEVFGVAPGSFAEYACAAENKLALKPANVSFEAAASVPIAGFTALQGLRDRGHIQPGQRVLVYGASGGVGMFAVQIAKALGGEVTAVCSTRNLDLARSIGADHVLDYTRGDFSLRGRRYDLIMAANGYQPILDYWRALSPDGTCVYLGGSLAQIMQGMLLGPVLSRLAKKKIGNMLARTNQDDLVVLADLLRAGKVVPVIDKRYPLSETADAMRYLMDDHARGKVVITVDHQ